MWRLKNASPSRGRPGSTDSADQCDSDQIRDLLYSILCVLYSIRRQWPQHFKISTQVSNVVSSSLCCSAPRLLSWLLLSWLYSEVHPFVSIFPEVSLVRCLSIISSMYLLIHILNFLFPSHCLCFPLPLVFCSTHLLSLFLTLRQSLCLSLINDRWKI